jgi:hypothetical protein
MRKLEFPPENILAPNDLEWRQIFHLRKKALLENRKDRSDRRG